MDKEEGNDKDSKDSKVLGALYWEDMPNNKIIYLFLPKNMFLVYDSVGITNWYNKIKV